VEQAEGAILSRTYERDLEAMSVTSVVTKAHRGWVPRITEYVLMSLWNTAIVYALYTIYVFLWLQFSFDQYVRWIAGGIGMSLLTGGLIVRANVWAKNRWFPR